MDRIHRLLALLTLAAAAAFAASCASEETAPRGPADDVSGLPWNRPMPGEHSGPMGGMPMQSH